MKKVLLPALIVLPLVALSIFQNKTNVQELEILVKDFNEASIVAADVHGVNSSTSFTSVKQVIDKSIYSSSLNVLTRDSIKDSKDFTDKKDDVIISPTGVFSSLNSLVEKYS
ncbi:hypothetical protein [Avrilella dinanensis]|uniref:Uncharacterized protein n=1 Tax=Avrilella dinanensis TaxID=2008672 RepID=A0A2M9R3Y0_9FLAO|nr:hypothetical protein [Avrilella dinanensis]PJR03561.1 hypothetical protein CDL10_02785 [Avrilella dinanensis]